MFFITLEKRWQNFTKTSIKKISKIWKFWKVSLAMRCISLAEHELLPNLTQTKFFCADYQTTLTYEELSTLITQIEDCLNSRPINAMSNDPLDLTSLTSGNFLIGASLTAVPEPYDGSAVSTLATTCLLQVTRMRNEFWRR